MPGPIRRYLEAALRRAELVPGEGGVRAVLAELELSVSAKSAYEALSALEARVEEEILRRAYAGERLPEIAGVGLPAPRLAASPTEVLAQVEARLRQLAELMGERRAPESLITWLSARGMKVVRVFADEDAETARVLNRLALFIGSRYAVLSKCLKKLKAALSTGKPLAHSLQKASPEEIQAVTQLCTLFKEHGFLESYEYKRRIVRAVPGRDPRFINFVNGGWLERYLELMLERELAGKKQVLRGLQFVLPDGEQGELDLLFSWRDRVFWVEAKTSRYQDRISRYAKFRRLMGLSPEESFLVLLDVPKERREQLAEKYGLSVVEPGELLSRLKDLA